MRPQPESQGTGLANCALLRNASVGDPEKEKPLEGRDHPLRLLQDTPDQLMMLDAGPGKSVL